MYYLVYSQVGDLVGKVVKRGDPVPSPSPVFQGCHEGLVLSINCFLMFIQLGLWVMPGSP